MTRSLPRLADLGTDLLVTTRPRRIFTLSLPYVGIAPLFAGAWIAGWRWLTPLIVFGIFVAVVTSTHDVVHRSLGLGGRTTEVALFLLGAVLLESGHAYRATHLQHHRTFPSHEDPEGYPANLSALGALLYGPVFLVRLWLWAFRRATRGQRIWLAAEAALPFAAVTVGAVFSRGLLVYAVMVIVGSWVYPVADHPPAAPPLRGHAAHADPHAARTHRPRPVPGADVPFGASPVPSGAEPQSPATRAEARPCTHRGGREALESALNRWRHARRPESVLKRRSGPSPSRGTAGRRPARSRGRAASRLVSSTTTSRTWNPSSWRRSVMPARSGEGATRRCWVHAPTRPSCWRACASCTRRT